MKTRRHFTSTRVALASAVLAMLFLGACNESRPPATPPAAAATKDLYVVFEGPWAIAPDPKDSNSVLLVAPKTATHRELYVAASNHSDLHSGIYELSFPSAMTPGAGTYDPAFLRVKIDPVNAQHVLDNKDVRYAVRLPKPDAYLPFSRHRSRADSKYPPDPSTEADYATGASLRYSVSSLNGFSVSGSPDTGSFKPLLLKVDTPFIHFMIEPTQSDDVCDTHSRQTYHDLVQLVGLTSFVDFPDDPDDCHQKDPQIVGAAKKHARLASPMDRIAAKLVRNLADVEAADTVGGGQIPSRYIRFVAGNRFAKGIAKHLTAALYYFFDVTGGGCKAPLPGGG